MEKVDNDTGKDLTYISDYEIKSGVRIGYKGLQTQLINNWIGPQMKSSSEEMDSFDVWDLTARSKFMENWEVKASVLNLFDEDYSYVYGYPMPERNYKLGITYKF